MSVRCLPIALAGFLSLLICTPSGVFAHGQPGDESLPRVTAPAATTKADHERRHEIFRILQGGALVGDEQLAEHLWRVAGSLATKDWTPPQVKIEIVVRTPRSIR